MLHVFGKREAPHVGFATGAEVDASHAWLSSVGGSQQGRVLVHYFRQVSGALGQAGCQGGKRVEVMAHRGCNAHSAIRLAVES